jgi:hypothetical protein
VAPVERGAHCRPMRDEVEEARSPPIVSHPSRRDAIFVYGQPSSVDISASWGHPTTVSRPSSWSQLGTSPAGSGPASGGARARDD